ncbi:MAG: LysE family transporter [Desulfobulbaceae bacterium]|nr:LysE family transporter [Desulfobulbaceae bacterium]
MVTGYLLSGTLLGLASGLAPGPLLTLVVSETLQHGSRAGVRVALSPLISDLPVVAITLLTVQQCSRFTPVLAGISTLGGLLVLSIGYRTFRTQAAPLPTTAPAPSRALAKGVALNLLSPHPWLFWFSVGAPLLLKAAAESLPAAAGFVAIFYLLLVGSKLLLAKLVDRWRNLLSSRGYLLTMRALGLLLLLFAVLLFRDGYRLLVSP